MRVDVGEVVLSINESQGKSELIKYKNVRAP